MSGKGVAVFMMLVIVVAYLTSMFPPDYALAFLLGLPLLVLATSSLSRSLLSRRRVAGGLSAFRAGDATAVARVHRFAAREFRLQIGRHRARTLGADSEWGTARAALAEAADEAQRSVAYWQARVRQEPDNELAAGQSRTASGLDDKLRSALAKLDARAETLLKFYNDCDARLSLMDRYNQDMEETRRLEELSGRTDVAIAGAEDTLLAIGEQFVREAQAVGRALGGLARVQIRSLAGDAPLDNIEYLADRIIESSDAERRAVEDLDRVLQQG
ncbi:MAG: hypothetical protein OXU69_05895 [Gemmatimonadota bacterium]|nr:hypothetical protein [Gemmatimonadota bacterium]MDE2984220.1 hypothetical protein [Gemmatimonadota bacterium]